MTDADRDARLRKRSYAWKLALSDQLRASTIRDAVEWLGLPAGSRGVDAGCGIGSHTTILAETVGVGGWVVGIDISQELVRHARRSAEEAGFADRTVFQVADLRDLPFKAAAFDWLWSVDCAGYPVTTHDPVGFLRRLRRVLKPGGMLAIAFWSSQVLLPGYPSLEARLNATPAGIAPYTRKTEPGQHHLRALGWLRAAGLEGSEARTFIGEVRSPLTPDERSALCSLFEMRWDDPRSEITMGEWDLYRCLTSPGSNGFLPDSADYYGFFTYTMFRGTVPS